MMDIVKRLRTATARLGSESQQQATVRRNQTIHEAADTIEDLAKYLTITVGILDKLNIMWMAETDAKAALAKAGVQ